MAGHPGKLQQHESHGREAPGTKKNNEKVMWRTDTTEPRVEHRPKKEAMEEPKSGDRERGGRKLWLIR